MPEVILKNAQLAFGHHPLLDGAELVIEPGERVGLIGRNGTGKSSLLKVIVGEHALDDGECWIAPHARVVYVAQEPQFSPGLSVFDAVAEGLGPLQALLRDYHRITHALETADGETAPGQWLEQLQQVQAELEVQHGWRFNSLVEATLSNLQLDADAAVDTLSGGWKKRVALARALVTEPTVLLLDEPTNHLDLPLIEWLENFLLGFNGAVLFITHDRHFLDRVCTRILELDRGQLRSCPGNYAIWQQRKAEWQAAEAQHNARFDKFWKEEEVWIRKGIEARRTRNEGRVRRLEELRRQRAARREAIGRVQLSLDAGERSGKLVAELDNVSFGFSGQVLLRDFSARIQRGDRMGLIGPNGAGKTTLLKLILGQLAPQQGRVKQGTQLEIAYFDQFRSALDEDATLADTISPGSDTVEINGQKRHVIGYLEEFLFPPARARSPVRTLSGGERNRLLLARLFARPANVLVLDEPTNDLDIDTLELLEALLQTYTGTVFLVSHDRAFLDNVVTSVFAFEGHGRVQEYVGGYSDWQAYKLENKTRQASAPAAIGRKQESAKPPVASDKPKNSKPGLNFNERRELAELPAKIEALEAEMTALYAALQDPALYREQAGQVAVKQQRVVDLEGALETAMARWEALEMKQAAG